MEIVVEGKLVVTADVALFSLFVASLIDEDCGRVEADIVVIEVDILVVAVVGGKFVDTPLVTIPGLLVVRLSDVGRLVVVVGVCIFIVTLGGVEVMPEEVVLCCSCVVVMSVTVVVSLRTLVVAEAVVGKEVEVLVSFKVAVVREFGICDTVADVADVGFVIVVVGGFASVDVVSIKIDVVSAVVFVFKSFVVEMSRSMFVVGIFAFVIVFSVSVAGRLVAVEVGRLVGTVFLAVDVASVLTFVGMVIGTDVDRRSLTVVDS